MGQNPLITIGPSSFAGHDQISEMDSTTTAKPVDPTPGPAGIQYPGPSVNGNLYAYGLIMEGSGSYPSTAAIIVDGANTWHRGIGITNSGGNVIDQVAFFDYSNSPTVFQAYGNHSNGIDLSNAYINGSAF